MTDKPKAPEPKEEPLKLPLCPHCKSIPIACKQPDNCKFEDVKK
jgi:hypothetical protein